MRRDAILAMCSSTLVVACTMLTGADQLITSSNPNDEINAEDGGTGTGTGGNNSKKDGGSSHNNVGEDGSTVGDIDTGLPPITEQDASSIAPCGDWQFDEGSAFNIADKSGHGHNGVATGGTWVADRNNASGQAFKLVSGTDQIAISAHPDFNRPANAKFTMMGWGKADEAPNHSYIMEIGFGQEGFGLELRNQHTLCYWDGVQHKAEANTGPSVVGSWHHYAVVVDENQARVYLDGVRLRADGVDNQPRTAVTMRFGVDVVEPSYFRGALDKLRYFKVALNDAQVAAEMNR